MNDYFQRDYDELKDLENTLIVDMKKRRDITSNSENTVRLEQQIFKELDTFGRKVDNAILGYKNKYTNNSAISEFEANKRINLLNEMKKSHQTQKTAYDNIINDKYQYVRKL